MGQGVPLRVWAAIEERLQNDRHLAAQKTCKQAIEELDRENRLQVFATVGLVFALTVFVGALVMGIIVHCLEEFGVDAMAFREDLRLQQNTTKENNR